MWHPGSEKLERPVFQPRDRGEVFWNTTLLSIEQISSLLQPIWVQGDYIDTATLRLPRLLHASSRTIRCTEILLAAEQRRWWWTPFRRDSDWNAYPSRKQGIHGKQAIKSGMSCKLARLARSVHWMYLQAHNNQSNQDKQQHDIYRLKQWWIWYH